ncbi:MAG: hypothetical protein J6U54_17335 [Clostridiales bacterium]|nr:hypothetical protein [Clostridiales bacterium]
MTNREKFIEVFGDNPQRHHITKSWWDEEYIPLQEPKILKTLSILDCAKKIKEHCTNAKWCFDCELGNGDGTCKLADNEYCYSLPTEWKLEEEKDDKYRT